MKKIYILLFLIVVTNFAKAQFPAPYCDETYVSNAEPITSVVFGSIANTSPATVGGVEHEDFTSISTNLTVGGSYSISVQGNTDGASYSDYIRVFIDWNQNNDFTDAGESFDIGILVGSTGVDGKTVTANIVVPAGAIIGSTRMRVTKHYNSYQNPCNAGTFGEYGEAEDYSVNVIAASNCTGTPVAGTITGPNQACIGNSFTLGLGSATVATGIHYQWQKTTIGGATWANTNIADTTSSVTIVQGNVGADYRCVLTCSFSSISVNSAAKSVTVQTNSCPPINDDICSAILLKLDSASDCQNTQFATSVGDPTFSCSTPNNTTWYKYTPSVTGDVVLVLTSPASGTALNGWLGVYEATGVCPTLALTDVTATALSAGCTSFNAGTTTNITATLTAGTDYYFMIDGIAGAFGNYCISMITPPTPPSTCATNTLPINAATSVTSTPAVVFKWTPVAGATSYDVYHSTTNPPTTLLGNTTYDTAAITGTIYNTTYYWYVVPRNAGGVAIGCDANTTSYTTGGVPASAANDDVCDAITLVLDGASDCKNSTYATSVGDPTFGCSSPNNTLWYRYTPATTGNVLFSFTPPSSGDTLYGWLGVYTASGTCPGALTLTNVTNAALGSCQSFGQNGNTITEFSATLTAGTEYYFMIDGVSGDVGQYCISIKTPPPPPANCTNNLLPISNAIDVPSSTTLKWTPVAGATSYDIYFGTANPPTTLFGNSNLDSVNITSLAFSTTYNWYVVPKNGGGSATGCDANITSFTTIAPPPPPTNDDCDSAYTLINNVSINATTISATESQPGELCNSFTGNANDDVWFSFTATQNGDATITEIPLAGSNFDGVIIAYSGTCAALTSIGCADVTFGGGTETVTLTGLVAGETYYCRVYGYGGSGTEGSFKITASGTALPVSISKFSGERKNGVNILSWTTANETNNKGYELQRSATGDNYLPVIYVESKAANGNSTTVLNYQASDLKPYAGNSYYRLKQIDKNGKSNFSNTILIKGEKVTTIAVTDIYPNPATKILNLIVAAPTEEKVSIVITDITGKILQNKSTQLLNGNNNVKLDVSNLALGSYMLKVLCNNGCNSAVVKFVKQ